MGTGLIVITSLCGLGVLGEEAPARATPNGYSPEPSRSIVVYIIRECTGASKPQHASM